MHTSAKLLNFYLFLILGGGLFCLIRHLLSNEKAGMLIKKPWKLNLQDFILFVALLFLSVIGGSFIADFLTKKVLKIQDSEWRHIISGLASQAGLLIFWLILLGFYKNFFGRFRFSRKPLTLVAGSGAYDFFLALVPIWATTLFWAFSLNFFSKLWGVNLALEQQSLVEFFVDNQHPVFVVVMIIFASVVAPITEELTFRAGIYRFLKGKMPPLLAAAISSLLFASMHYNLLSFLPLFLIGLLLTRSYERTGNILTSIVFHSLFNLNTLILLIFSPEFLKI